MEIFAELFVGVIRAILKWFFVDLILAGLGRLYFAFRYRNRAKRIEVLHQKYDGFYSNIIRLFFLNLFYYAFGAILIAMWLVAVFGFFGWIVMKGI